jgi:hypothetical protein
MPGKRDGASWLRATLASDPREHQVVSHRIDQPGPKVIAVWLVRRFASRLAFSMVRRYDVKKLNRSLSLTADFEKVHKTIINVMMSRARLKRVLAVKTTGRSFCKDDEIKQQ